MQALQKFSSFFQSRGISFHVILYVTVSNFMQNFSAYDKKVITTDICRKAGYAKNITKYSQPVEPYIESHDFIDKFKIQ